MNLFDPKTIAERKRRASVALNSVLTDKDLVLICCGEPQQKPGGLDQTYPFLPHPDYFWLTGYRRAFGVTAYTKAEGFQDFVKPVAFEETLWEGSIESPQGKDLSQLNPWMSKNQFQRVFVLGQAHPQTLSLSRGSGPESQLQIQEAFNQARRAKDAAEVDLVRKAARIAHQGYKKLKDFIRPGVTERQIQLEFESEVLRAGAEKFPYDTIVGTGTHSAILHAIPTDRVVQEGDLVLIDAGVDLQDYCVDITRVFSANKKMNQRQKDIFDIVHKAQAESIAQSTVGTEWHDVHRTSAQIIAEGLKNLGILRGETQGLLESGAISLFFPHGVGHMVGLRVRDVGADVTKKPRTCCGVRVRVDFPLQESYLMTVEPGLYFIQTLLDQPSSREKYRDQVQWSEVEKWKDFGGIRLEDDILITAQGPENLTGFIEKES